MLTRLGLFVSLSLTLGFGVGFYFYFHHRKRNRRDSNIPSVDSDLSLAAVGEQQVEETELTYGTESSTYVQEIAAVSAAEPEPIKEATPDSESQLVPNPVTPYDLPDIISKINRENITLQDAEALKLAVLTFAGEDKCKILALITQCSAFSCNMVTLRDAGWLEMMIDLLHETSDDFSQQSDVLKYKMVQSLINLACNEENQLLMLPLIDDLFLMSEDVEDSDLGIACLTVLSNLTLTAPGCSRVEPYIGRLYALLDEEDAAELKQVLSVLLNLSCNPPSIPALLAAQAPSNLNLLVTGASPFSDDDNLFGKWLRLVHNLFRSIREHDWTEADLPRQMRAPKGETMLSRLQELRLQMKTSIFLLTIKCENEEIGEKARELYQILQPPS